MNFLLRFFIVSAALAFMVFIVVLVRRRRLSEIDALIWLLAGVCVLVGSVFPSIPDTVAMFLGIHYSAAIVFFLAIVFILFVAVYQSLRLSDLKQRNKIFAQRLALLEEEWRRRRSGENEP